MKYWKKTLQGALNNSHPPGGYDPQTVVGFVEEVRGLFLQDPYDFADGYEGVQQAFEILKDHYKDEVDILWQELLATELNQVSGRGLVSQPGLQLALISWGESLIVQAWQQRSDRSERCDRSLRLILGRSQRRHLPVPADEYRWRRQRRRVGVEFGANLRLSFHEPARDSALDRERASSHSHQWGVWPKFSFERVARFPQRMGARWSRR